MRLALLAALGASALLAASGASDPPPEGAVGAFLAAKAKARADAAAAAAAQATVAGGAASVDAAGASAFGDAYDLYAAGYDDDDLWDEEDHPDFQAGDVYDDLDDYDPLDDDFPGPGLFGGGAGRVAGGPECSPPALGESTDSKDLAKLFFSGVAPCDLRVTGLDASVEAVTLPGDGKLDGVYAVAGCHAGRPLYVRRKGAGGAGAKQKAGGSSTAGSTAPATTPPGEDPDARVLWYSAAFRDWDLAAGSTPTEGDILAYGGSGGREPRPGRVSPAGWRLAADKASPAARDAEAVAVGPTNGDGYVRLDAVSITCADGSPDPGPLPAAAKAGGGKGAAGAGAAGAAAGAPSTTAASTPAATGPLLTDAEMGAQYSAVYARARRARAAGRTAGASGAASATAAAAGLALLGCAALVGLPLAAARAGRRRAGGPRRPLAGLGLGRRPVVAVSASSAVTAVAGDLAAEVAAALRPAGVGVGGGEKRSL